MLKKIFLDDLEFHFTKSHLPILIHGEEGLGASLFTISVLADMYSQGIKVIALTGYPMAKEEFGKQIESSDENAQFFTKEKTNEFIDLVTKTFDVNESVILIKNIELFNEEIFNAVKDLKNLIISGDVAKCSFKEELLKASFNTKIYFSPLNETLPQLQKYQGYLQSPNHNGMVTLEV